MPSADEGQRLDRELMELLSELRVALPGVQVLFAFLLVIPFSSGYHDLSRLGNGLYLGALLCTAIATAMLVAPSAYHRLRFRAADKERLIRVGNRLTIIGLVFVAIAIALAIFLVTDVVVSGPAGAIAAGVTAVVFGWLWFVLPFGPRRSRDR